jgi:hypothetical protein
MCGVVHVYLRTHFLQGYQDLYYSLYKKTLDTVLIAILAAIRKQLKPVTEQFEELEERNACVVCQHDAKQVRLQPSLRGRTHSYSDTSTVLYQCAHLLAQAELRVMHLSSAYRYICMQVTHCRVLQDSSAHTPASG